jgi:hypothetical protein
LEQPLSPYHQELKRDLADWELFRAGLAAYERIIGITEGEALGQLSAAATSEQREQLISRATRAEEFYKLPGELQARLRRAA